MTNLAGDTRSIVIQREMPHPVEKVWRALTQGPLIEEWLPAACASLCGQLPDGMAKIVVIT